MQLKIHNIFNKSYLRSFIVFFSVTLYYLFAIKFPNVPQTKAGIVKNIIFVEKSNDPSNILHKLGF